MSLHFLNFAACIVVGLLVYYVGVMGIQCQNVPGDSETLSSSSDSNASKKVSKVSYSKNSAIDGCVIQKRVNRTNRSKLYFFQI